MDLFQRDIDIFWQLAKQLLRIPCPLDLQDNYHHDGYACQYDEQGEQLPDFTRLYHILWQSITSKKMGVKSFLAGVEGFGMKIVEACT
jgi:hypothetical protein